MVVRVHKAHALGRLLTPQGDERQSRRVDQVEQLRLLWHPASDQEAVDAPIEIRRRIGKGCGVWLGVDHDRGDLAFARGDAQAGQKPTVEGEEQRYALRIKIAQDNPDLTGAFRAQAAGGVIRDIAQLERDRSHLLDRHRRDAGIGALP